MHVKELVHISCIYSYCFLFCRNEWISVV